MRVTRCRGGSVTRWLIILGGALLVGVGAGMVLVAIRDGRPATTEARAEEIAPVAEPVHEKERPIRAPQPAQPYDEEEFQKELKLAVGSRDSRVEHLRKALALRPGHPDNVHIEFQIGVLLSQWTQSPEEPLWREAALDVFAHICEAYNPLDYGDSEVDTSGRDAQNEIAQAAVFAGDFSGRKDPEKAREYYWKAMTCLHQTWERRLREWLNQPAPEPYDPDSPFSRGELEKSKYDSRAHWWKENQKKAADGDVLTIREVSTARLAVERYGMGYGPQSPEIVAVHMDKIIKAFPGSPMARFAEEQIRLATQPDLPAVSEEKKGE